jgi:hypothetical protein
MTNRQRVAAIRRARRHLQDSSGYRPNGIHYREIDKILNALEADFKPKVKWDDIGPVTLGGASLLDMTLTHQTHGIPLFPAVDLAWGAGVSMYAPEPVTVDYRDTSANPGEALYMTGRSGMRYWFAHIDRDYILGTQFAKGAFLGKTVDTSKGGGPHGHVGVNGEVFLGKGEQFKYGRDGDGPDYTLGAPTIRNQLS